MVPLTKRIQHKRIYTFVMHVNTFTDAFRKRTLVLYKSTNSLCLVCVCVEWCGTSCWLCVRAYGVCECDSHWCMIVFAIETCTAIVLLNRCVETLLVVMIENTGKRSGTIRIAFGDRVDEAIVMMNDDGCGTATR